MHAPRSGSAPAFLNTSAANPLGPFGGYGQAMGLGTNLYGTTYSSAFDSTENVVPTARPAEEQAGRSNMSAFEAGYLHAATAMGMPPASYGAPSSS